MTFPPPTPRQARIIWFAVTALAVAMTLAIVGVMLLGLGRALVVLSPVLWPMAVAAVIAFILDPVVGWFERRHVPRLRAILLVFAVAAVLVLLVLNSVVPRVVGEARDLAQRIPTYARSAREKLEKWIDRPPPSLVRFLPVALRERFGGGPTSTPPAILTNVVVVPPVTNAVPVLSSAPETGRTEPEPGAQVAAGGAASGAGGEPPWWTRVINPAALRTAGDWVATILPEMGRWALGQVGRVASWFGVMAGLALIPIYAFYFLLEKTSISRSWRDYLPVSDSRFKDELVWLVQNINDALIVFFRGQVLVAICDGILYALGFLLIGLPYAVLLGVVATVLTIVPFLGAIITCVTALVIAVVQFGDWRHPLAVLGVFLVVQGIEGWVVQPKIIGDRVGLHPVTIIVALLVGTTLMGGILGGLLAIPATAVIRALMFRYVWRRRAESGNPEGRSDANCCEETV